MKEAVLAQGARGAEPIDARQPLFQPLRHGKGDRVVERHDGRRRQPDQLPVQIGDLGPIGVISRPRTRMSRCNCGLQLVGTRALVPQGLIELLQALRDLDPLPDRAVLILERHELAVAVDGA